MICLMTNSTQWAYHKTLKPEGIIIHSSGQNNPFLRRYVQPSKKDENYSQLLAELGENRKHNDWNHIHTSYNYHYWIGKNRNNDVISIQTFPLNIKTWNDNYIHICICEDKLNDKDYLANCLAELTILCDDLCKDFNWDEKVIFDHSEISNFPDSNYWLEKHGFNIFSIRAIIFGLHHPNSKAGKEVIKTWQNKNFSI